MPLALLLAATAFPVLPVEAVLALTLAAGFGLMAVYGPESTPPPATVTTDAILASHGWM